MVCEARLAQLVTDKIVLLIVLVLLPVKQVTNVMLEALVAKPLGVSIVLLLLSVVLRV